MPRIEALDREARLVWDASALMAACRADRLDVLSEISAHESVTTRAVLAELANHGVDGKVVGSGWPTVVDVSEYDELIAFARWSSVLGVAAAHNLGEATVCAWAEVHGAVPVIDDAEAKKVAEVNGLRCVGTLRLFAEAVREGRALEQSLTGTIDALMSVGLARYPIRDGAGFGSWARENRLLPRT